MRSLEEEEAHMRNKEWWRKPLTITIAMVMALALVAVGCGDDDDEDSGGGSSGSAATTEGGGGEVGKVAVLLPDSKSSVRWETVDRPSLQAAFEAAGVEADIQNAEGDKSTQQQQAEQAITNGAKVLLLVNLDSGSGAAIAANAKSRDVKVIDYDRLTLDTDATDYYVSFDNEKVGELQGQGLVDCLEASGKEKPAVAVLNGSPTDNNATLFKNGYDSIINPKFESGEWTEVDDQSVPDWDNQRALTIFEQMLQKAKNNVDGVLAANDGLGNAAISALKQRKLDQIPVTGQDATLQGIQNIVAGDQCMTVYKAVKKEADAAAELAIALAKGEEPQVETTPIDNGTREVPSVLLEPVPVTKDNIGEYIGEPDFPKKEEICTGELASACEEAGL
jgi:D-xylose transport system substrate-binding protein